MLIHPVKNGESIGFFPIFTDPNCACEVGIQQSVKSAGSITPANFTGDDPLGIVYLLHSYVETKKNVNRF